MGVFSVSGWGRAVFPGGNPFGREISTCCSKNYLVPCEYCVGDSLLLSKLSELLFFSMLDNRCHRLRNKVLCRRL